MTPHRPFMDRVLTLAKRHALSEDAAYELLAAYMSEHETPSRSSDIAIIGLSARMPRSSDLAAFWQHLLDGRDLIGPLPPERLRDVEEHFRSYPEDAFCTGKRFLDLAYLDRIDSFDASFFGITPAEAEVMDPAHRLFLEVAYEAFEDAGHAGDAMRGTNTGIYVGNPGAHYVPALVEATAAAVIGNVPAFLGAHLAYRYDLRGPCFGTLATCSSSLVAVHLACQGLRNGDCEMAICGGASLTPFPGNVKNEIIRATGITSENERSRPFDASASGTGLGEGVVVFLLKPLDRALRDGDSIHAVIKGSAVNNDGASAGITAPNPLAHARLLSDAWRRASIDPRELGYIEAHGTGTVLGDPIEIRGIQEAFARAGAFRQTCAIGSIKGNIGHLADGGAGAAGLLKLVLAARDGVIPPSIHFEKPNPHIDFSRSALYVADRRIAWEGRRLGGVSSFGFQGTNAHVVIENAGREGEADEPLRESVPFVLSAATGEQLREVGLRLLPRLKEGVDLGRAAFTLATGREHLPQRIAFAARTREAAVRALEACLRDHLVTNHTPGNGVDSRAMEACRRYLAGQPLAFEWDAIQRARVRLPTYPFKRQRHWATSAAQPRTVSRLPEAPAKPATETEIVDAVRARWKQWLGAAEIGRDDSFFAVGGNSLLAMQVVNACARDFGAAVPLAAFLAEPTPRGLARQVWAAVPTKNEPAEPAEAREHALSFSQESFWFLARTEENASFYNVASTLRIAGPLDRASFEKALRLVQTRHEVLRSRIATDERGMPTVTIVGATECPLPLLVLDTFAFDESQRDSEAVRMALRESQRPFALEGGALFRASLVHVRSDLHVLSLALHHVIGDLASLANLIRELATAYHAYRRASAPEWSPLSLQYREHAERQRRAFEGGERERLLEFWKEYLRGAPKLEVPTDAPRPAEPALDGRTLQIALDTAHHPRIKELCRASAVTPFTFFLALTLAWLHLETSERDLVVGTETANRGKADLEPLIGAFVNPLALRVTIPEEASFHDHLRATERALLAALSHQELPFSMVVDAIRPPRGINDPPFFRWKVLMADFDLGALPEGELAIRPVEPPILHAPFDLTVRIHDAGDRYLLTVTYNVALFREPRIERFCRDLEAMAAAAAREPSLPLAALPRTNGAGCDAKPRRKIKDFAARSHGAPPVEMGLLQSGHRFPLVIRPRVPDLQLEHWLSQHRALVEEKLLEHGALLFRGFDVRGVSDFSAAARAVHPVLVEYVEPSTPREQYEPLVYESSRYPAYHSIHVHPELCYTYRWPMKALFHATIVASRGGETPIADNREILGRLSPRLRDKFERLGVMYLRNYGDGLLVPWEKVFGTRERTEVEAHCRANAPMVAEWKADGGLRTRQVRAGILRHPVANVPVWFNQSHIFHSYSLGSVVFDQLLAQFGEDDLPVHAFFGNGSRISRAEMDEVYAALEHASYDFPWEAGDVLLVDNMLMSHGRRAFEGDRKVIVCFVEPGPAQPFEGPS